MIIPKNKKLILFDGVCNLCNTSIQYIIKRDKKNTFIFTPLQSEIGCQLIKAYKIDPIHTDSILFYSETKGIKNKSTAILYIAYHLGFPNNLMTFFFIIPNFIRNWIYDYIAKNRYKWYGKKESCMIPTPELENKFI